MANVEEEIPCSATPYQCNNEYSHKNTLFCACGTCTLPARLVNLGAEPCGLSYSSAFP